jgi:hypothetical protein
MNDLEAGHSLAPCRDTQSPPEEETPAPATVYGRQESDESYEGVVSREGNLRIVNCRDDIQWIVQRLTGGSRRSGVLRLKPGGTRDQRSKHDHSIEPFPQGRHSE